MGANTEIQWATHTFNPWRGCSKVHEGCAHCYAERDAKRFPLNRGVWGPNGTRVMAAADMWRQPIKWNKAAEKAGERHRVFCASLADVFEDWQNPMVDHNGSRLLMIGGPNYRGTRYVPTDFHIGKNLVTMDMVRRDLFELIDKTPHLDWLLVTKRPENIRRMWPSVQGAKDDIGGDEGTVSFYRQNVWLLTSVSNQATADKQIPPLLKCHDLCPVLGLSVEPLLGPIDFSAYFGGEYATIEGSEPNYNFGLDWIIGGGESGPGARPMHPGWVRNIRDQCIKASVPFFFKQWGELAPLGPTSGLDPDHHYPGRDKRLSVHSGVPMDEPTSMFQIGKKNAGRTLDGQTWDQMPEPKASVPT